MASRLRAFGLGSGLLLASALSPLQLSSASPGADEDARLVRAGDQLQILFEGRLELMLLDAMAITPLADETAARFREQTVDAVAEFFADHELEVGEPPMYTNEPGPIHYESFSSFLTSAKWLKVFEAELPEEIRNTWNERRQERQAKIESSLLEMFQAEVATSLCLTEPEQKEVLPALEEAAKRQAKKGLVGKVQTMWFSNEVEDHMGDLLKAAKLKDYLAKPRAAIWEKAVLHQRTSYMDYCLEAEFWLYGREDAEELRGQLYGCAEALIHRNGQTLRVQDLVLEQSGKPDRDKFWEKALRGICGLAEDEDLDAVPSRDKTKYLEARAAFYLAVVDERAVFTNEQKESLLPLFLEFVELEQQSKSRYSPMTPQLSGKFGIAPDGTVKAPANANLSSKQKSKVTALRDTCTQQQLDVLDV